MFVKMATAAAAAALVGGTLWAGSEGHLDPALEALAEMRAGVTAQTEADARGGESSSEAAHQDAEAEAGLGLELNLSGEAEAGVGDS